MTSTSSESTAVRTLLTTKGDLEECVDFLPTTIEYPEFKLPLPNDDHATSSGILPHQPGLITLMFPASDALEEWTNKSLVLRTSFPSYERHSETNFVDRNSGNAPEVVSTWIHHHDHLIERAKFFPDKYRWVSGKELVYASRACRIIVATTLYSITNLESSAQWCRVWVDVVKGTFCSC